MKEEMKRHIPLCLLLALVACRPAAPVDTVESLTADPERLEAVQRQCKLDWAETGDAVCNAAAEAYRQRFMGDREGEDAPERGTGE